MVDGVGSWGVHLFQPSPLALSVVPPIPRSPRGEEVCNISENCFCTVLRIEGKDASGTSDLKGRSSPHPISVLKSLPRDREAADADHS